MQLDSHNTIADYAEQALKKIPGALASSYKYTQAQEYCDYLV
jgi:hypothetical protein